MADFLNRLAGRALGAVRLAEPILPARFSPGAEQIGWPAPEHNDAIPAVDTRPRIHDVEQQSHYEPRQSEPVSPAFDVPRNTHVLRASSPPRAQTTPGPTSVDAPFPKPRLERTSNDMGPRAERTPQHHLDSRPDSIGESSSGDPPRNLPARPPFTEPGSSARSGAVAHATGMAWSEAQRNTGARTAAPTLRITIGRIDVRAEIASPVAAPVSRTRPSQLSLDQFLHRGAGGR